MKEIKERNEVINITFTLSSTVACDCSTHDVIQDPVSHGWVSQNLKSASV